MAATVAPLFWFSISWSVQAARALARL